LKRKIQDLELLNHSAANTDQAVTNEKLEKQLADMKQRLEEKNQETKELES
jgi:hypothetical protein